MARNTIQIPITKSSNTGLSKPFVLYRRDEWMGNSAGYVTVDEEIITINGVSNKLYSARASSLTGFGVAWDSNLVPKDKKIVSARLYLYTLKNHSRAIYFRYIDFSEGSIIPSYSPSDGAKSGGIASGWDYIDIGELKGHSIVIYGALQRGVEYSNNENTKEYWNEYWELYSHRNSNYKPYLEIIYDDIPPEKPTSLYPSGITLNPRDIIRFSWLHNSEEKLEQKGFTLQYSTNSGGTWTTVNQTTPNQYYDMPANTLPTTGTVMWRVKTTDGNDSESEYSTASFALGVVPQKAPIPISPISQYLDENKPIRFEWSFTGGSGSEVQSKFDLQYSTNGGNTWTTKTVTSGDNFYIVPENTFVGGNITWRVRTYNNWDEVSPYSENRSFTVIGSPPIPQILDWTNSARPTIYWNSYNQQGYELQILKNNEIIYDTGLIPRFEKNYKIPLYLMQGEYKARLRIINEYNLYSPWTEKIFYLVWMRVEGPILTAYNGEYGVTLKVEFDDPYKDEEDFILTVAKTLIYRDGVCIGETKNNTFIDYGGENNREYKYFARNVNDEKWEEDSFADSDIKLGRCSFKNNTLATLKDPDKFIKLKYALGSIPKKNNIINTLGTLNYYDGRVYPVVEYSEFLSLEKNLSFTLRTREEIEELRKLISKKETLLYRDFDGENIIGSILTLSDEKIMFGYDVNFTMTKAEV